MPDHNQSQDQEKEFRQGENSPDKAQSAPMKPWAWLLLLILGACLVVAIGFWAWHYWTRGRFVQSTNDAYLQADQVVVSSKVAGTVVAVDVNDNDLVQAGQKLVSIDDRALHARVDQALAQAAQGRASIKQYESQIAEQTAAIEQAQAQSEGAREKFRYSSGEAQRYAPLAASGAERSERLAEMTSNRDQAAATLRQDEASVVQARRRIVTLGSQVDLAKAQVAQAMAMAQQSQVDLDSAQLTASTGGRIGDRQVRVGQYAAIGTRLMTIVPVDALYVVANFKETQVGRMKIGQPVRITVDALPDETIDGTVDSFSPGTGAQFALIPATNATGNFTKIVQRVPVKIRINAGPEARKVLLPGLSTEVAVDTYSNKNQDEQAKKEDAQNQTAIKDHRDQSEQAGHDQPAAGIAK